MLHLGLRNAATSSGDSRDESSGRGPRQDRHHRHRRPARPLLARAAAPRREGRVSASTGATSPAGRGTSSICQVDLRSKKARDIFRGERCHGPRPPGHHARPAHDRRRAPLVERAGTTQLLEACASYGVPQGRRAVVGERLRPAARQRAVPRRGRAAPGGLRLPAMRDLIEVDMLASSFFWKRAGRDRDPAAGAHRRRRPQRAVELPAPARCRTLLGFDPMVQVIHELRRGRGDCARAHAGVRGIYNVRRPRRGAVVGHPARARRPTVPVPHPLARAVLTTLSRGKLRRSPSRARSHPLRLHGRRHPGADDSRSSRVTPSKRPFTPSTTP